MGHMGGQLASDCGHMAGMHGGARKCKHSPSFQGEQACSGTGSFKLA